MHHVGLLMHVRLLEWLHLRRVLKRRLVLTEALSCSLEGALGLERRMLVTTRGCHGWRNELPLSVWWSACTLLALLLFVWSTAKSGAERCSGVKSSEVAKRRGRRKVCGQAARAEFSALTHR